MIEYEYTLVRDEGDEERTFKPDKIPNKLDNLSYIEGPNSSGKSTLLNILALGFHGYKNKEIPKSLQMKMASLINSNYQNLTFKIKITNKDDSLALISERKDPKSEIVIHEICDGKKRILTPGTLLREYNVIYDIPIDPTARLKQLTQDIQDAQSRYGNCVGELRASIRNLIDDIRHSKDPNRIDELRRFLRENEKETQIKEKAGDLQGEELDILEKYTYLKFYQQYEYECEKLFKEIEKRKRNEKKVQREQKGVSRQFYTHVITLRTAIKEMQETFNQATSYLRSILPKNEQNHMNIWERIDLNQVPINFGFDDNLRMEIIHFENILKNLVEKKYTEEKLREGQFYDSLLKFMEFFKDLNIVLPGGKSVKEFVNECEKEKQKFEPILISSENIEKTQQLITDLKQKKNDIETRILPELKSLRDKNPDVFTEKYRETFVDDNFENLQTELDALKQKFDFYEREWIKKDRPEWNDLEVGREYWEKYASYTEQQLRDEISRKEENIVTTKGKLDSLNTAKERLKIQISELDKKKDHSRRKYLDELEDTLMPAVQSLEQKLQNHFDVNIKEIADGKAKHSEDKLKEQYYDAIFTFLAKKIGYVRYLTKEYKVTYIDLIDEKIKAVDPDTDKIKTIRFPDMGTGQGQSAYLMGKLNTSDNRKIIALFDEVAMMDSSSLAPIYKKFKQLYDDDRLLVGIVVQRADTVNVVSKI